jgi:type IV pilus assembly protein PilO
MADKLSTTAKFTKEQTKTIIAFALFTLAFGYLFIKYIWTPYSQRVEKARVEIEKINKDITKAKVAAKRFDKVLAELNQLKKRAELSEKRLPRGKELPELIFELMRVTRKYDIRINYITPRPSVEKQFYFEDTYKMSITGDYHIVGLFIASMVTSDRVFTIKNLSMSETQKDGEVEARFDLVAYQYKG